jgi:mono/diheme cytochrome c family protein
LRAEDFLPRPAAALAVLLLLPAAGCRQNMHNQNKLKPFRSSVVFADGTSARPLPAHTVARGDLRADAAYYTGNAADGKPVQQVPFPVTRALLDRGHERYNAYCSPCHDRVGTGRGMIVRRGYKQPPSFHEERLRASEVGYFFNVATEGFGVMPSYASQVPAADRWAIAAYIRVLQMSQNARLADLPEPARQAVLTELETAPAAGTAAEGAHAPAHGEAH